ncbi:MAG: GYD domain-containing protein [Spirochaetota bacterium]
MSKFFMFGKYTSDAIKGIKSERTKKATAIIEKFGGKLESIYALMGEYDIVIIGDFPEIQAALKTSIALNKLTGISFSTSPAITVEEFDKIAAET